ncbi:MAG: hypothetical protein KatS3mg065_0032 [Chloroflexota bacterium]|nr:MAG: hypothetical protein KatS3mg065_0032 [Chloroflexota bacterium]
MGRRHWLAVIAAVVIVAAVSSAAGGTSGDPAEREASGGSRSRAPSVAPSGAPQGDPSTNPAICEGTAVFVDRALVPTTRELVEAAEAVVVGELRTNGSVRSRSSDGRFTHMAYEFRVTEVVRGPLSEGAVVQLAGITLDATGCIVREADAEPMVPGGRYLAFIAPSPRGDGVYVAVGGPQGLFSVAADGTLAPLAPGAPTSGDFAGRSVSEIGGRLSVEGS